MHSLHFVLNILKKKTGNVYLLILFMYISHAVLYIQTVNVKLEMNIYIYIKLNILSSPRMRVLRLYITAEDGFLYIINVFLIQIEIICNQIPVQKLRKQ